MQASPGIKDTIEEMDTLVKEKVKSNRTQNIQEIWDTMKISNLRIVGIEIEDSHFKGPGNIFTKLREENSSNLKATYL